MIDLKILKARIQNSPLASTVRELKLVKIFPRLSPQIIN
jgi:hypothetical protein